MPDEYEAVTGISKGEYEEQLLERAHFYLLDAIGTKYERGRPSHTVRGALAGYGRVEAIGLEGEDERREIVVLFRLDEQPGRKFGWRAQVWPVPNPKDPVVGTADKRASLFPIYIEEEVLSTPPPKLAGPPDDDGVEWL